MEVLKYKQNAYILLYMCFFCHNWRLHPIVTLRRMKKMINISNILRCFPINIYKKIDSYFKRDDVNINLLEEIRIRANKPIILKIGQDEAMIGHITTSEEILEILGVICDNSIYTYQNQICNRLHYNAGWTQSRNNWKCCHEG